MDLDSRRFATSHLRNLRWAYAEVKQRRTNAPLAAAIDVCRKAAVPDHDHPDYDPLWTLPG